jgi:uncharacterized protein
MDELRAASYEPRATSHEQRVTSNEPRPWYREPWPWLLMAGPAAVLAAGAVTTWLAVTTADGLVADDYYRRGLAINREIGRDRRAAALGISAQVEIHGGTMRVRLQGRVAADVLFVRLAHATRAGHDERLRLPLVAPATYEVPLPELAPGRWSAVIEDAQGEWRIVKEDL